MKKYMVNRIALPPCNLSPEDRQVVKIEEMKNEISGIIAYVGTLAIEKLTDAEIEILYTLACEYANRRIKADMFSKMLMRR